ncbi:MAG: hypothetical protein FJZ89_11495 [Chloroflexi bacterium]|nr:hypothetical protein [Chloroflexota bacterium]
MKKVIAILTLILVLIGAVLAGRACWLAAPTILGAGPDGIELRPAPGAISPEAALPQLVARYERGACQRVTDFHGVNLGAEAMACTYTGPNGSVVAISARLASYHDAAQTVSDVAEFMKAGGFLSSSRLLAEKPDEGWWSASGKRNCATWHAEGGEVARSGFIWQNGQWCFILTSESSMARSDVSKEFPY